MLPEVLAELASSQVTVDLGSSGGLGVFVLFELVKLELEIQSLSSSLREY